jgi:hypothetical protein
MKTSRIFLTRAGLMRHYPSFFSRAIFSAVCALLFLDFDYVDTGKRITEGNYWGAKAMVFVGALILTEYIFRIHLWCTKKYRVNGGIQKWAIHLFILGVITPQLFIWAILTKWLGVTYVPLIASTAKPQAAVAMIGETVFNANLSLIFFFYNIPQRVYANFRKNRIDILTYRFGAVCRTNNAEVLCIAHFNGANIVVRESANIRKLVSSLPISRLISTLPAEDFEVRRGMIFRKTVDAKSEAILRDHVNRSFDFYTTYTT